MSRDSQAMKDIEISKRLGQIKALGAILGSTDWDSHLEGEDLSEYGLLIKNLAKEIEDLLEAPEPKEAVPEGGA